MMELTAKKLPCLSCGAMNNVLTGNDDQGKDFEATVCNTCDAIHCRRDGKPWELVISGSAEQVEMLSYYICAMYRKVSDG